MDKRLYEIGAKYYDGAYQNNPNLEDVPFYLDLARRFGGPVLEIACGTGRVLLEIARQGIDIWGVDFSKDQLAVLRTKLQQEPLQTRNRVRIIKDDMRTFSLRRRFPLVIVPFRPMQHMYTIEDQISALNAAKAHLAAKGLLAFDVFYPNYAALLQPPGEETLELEWPVPGHAGQVVRRYFRRTKVNFLEQYFEGEFVYRTFEGDRLINEERADFKLGYYTYPQLLLLFRHCALEVVEQYGNFKREPIDICKEMIFLLRPAAAKRRKPRRSGMKEYRKRKARSEVKHHGRRS
jgi:SAM-dependent methyltransferase